MLDYFSKITIKDRPSYYSLSNTEYKGEVNELLHKLYYHLNKQAV